jgi:inhibitor of growth protein 3
MPRDDLTINWNRHKMVQVNEHLDCSTVLEDFLHRAANLPAEIQFMQEEIADKDRQMQICLDIIANRDANVQKWIRLNGSLVPNPKEPMLNKVMADNYDKSQLLQEEKVALAEKSRQAMDRHLRFLDTQIKLLQDRGEFPNDPDLPSLLRPAQPEKDVRSSAVSGPLAPIPNSSTPSATRIAQQLATQRLPSTQLQPQQLGSNMSASAPATPAAALLMNRQARESSAGAANKRQRIQSGLGPLPVGSSGLARHSSIGPGTPKAGTPTSTRAGSLGPSRKASAAASKKVAPHKLGPGSVVQKSKPGKSGLSRVKRTGNKKSPSSTNDSELSDAESGSLGEEEEVPTPPPGKKVSASANVNVDQDMFDAEEDEGSDDKKYCICQKVSFGDMVACDNDDCPYEWFHWPCVGLKSEPVGTWICPVCTKKDKK